MYFVHYAPEKIPYAIDRYKNEAYRLYTVLNQRLKDHEYLAGEYSIADIATYPWIHIHEWAELSLEELPYLQRWHTLMSSRRAVVKGMNVPEKLDVEQEKTKEELEQMGRKML